ncbi:MULTISPECIES: Bug family tripartite tricarboxylate transporter substrate binding protein [Comamonas]|jgi:tripartite-type tricarboxylate transporter receptor subunit TctC|uniref:Tripartite tricarboxylate transporter substrate binding protein n=1 Tax=Comamonas squillarum TaxID=2977320 RepID=A0ABY5ZY22_9BURK|nr:MULTISPECIES: tripartite tricarboxylate transporter substrate binding protein [Comamonas]UXC18381.1 tripartite tricarboxylate transporter substrate binding protein [Comamonas sp. PR12]
MNDQLSPTQTPANRDRRRWLLRNAAWGAASLLAGQHAWAQSPYPSRPVRLVVPFAAGGATDVLGRLLAKALEPGLGQPVVVDNKVGAAGAIGATQVAHAEPDGYNVLMGGVGTNIVLEHTMPDLGYRPQRDFAAVASICNVDYVLVVAQDSPYQTLGELLADAKKTPGKLRYMSTGPLGPLHVAMEYLGKLSGAQMIHAPYKGEAPALPDLLQQRVDMGMMTALFTRPQVQSGKLRVLATLSAQRMASWPEIPTVAELGYPGYAAPIWNGFFVPRKTSAQVVERLGRTTVAQLQAPELKNLLEKQGVSVTAQGPEAYEKFLQAERLRWQHMIRESQVLTTS